MIEKMVCTQVYLPRDIYENLKHRAETHGITIAMQIREALVQYIVVPANDEDRHIIPADDPIWDMIGMGKGGPEDGSVNHDKYIYARDWD